MKKFIMLLSLIALFLTPIFALAEQDFTLDETSLLNGMSRSWAQGYEPVSSNGVMTLHFPLASGKCDGRVTVTLRMKDETVSPFKGSMTAQYQRSDGLYRAALRLELRSDRVSGDYAAELVVTGQDAEGKALSGSFPLVIRIRDGLMPEENAHPQLEDLTASLIVGADGTLTAKLTNPSRYAAMTGLLLSINDPTGDVLPASTDKLPLPDLLPGESTDIEVPLTVTPSASVSLHQLQLTLVWTSLSQPGLWTEAFTLPVTQTIRLEQGGVTMPSSILQGNQATVSLPLMNMGRGDLRNVLATLVLPGITEGQSVLVGAIAAGESRDAKIIFTPGKTVLGEVSGEVRVTYEDLWGNAESFSLPVSLTVEEPAPAPAVVTLTQEIEKRLPDWLLPALGGACGLLLLALILQGSLLRRKIRRLEEDKL
ncbi:MAG: hypothetical protein J1E43_03870 [Christensenellaceae bacterium]|nr:hypothetical protein [Christensenellaceae bacterium]